MSKLEKLQCTSCGGHIDRVTLTCQMCGMQYRLNEDMQPVRVEVSHCKLVNLGTCVGIPSYVLAREDKESIMEYTLRELAHNMAEKILPLMEFQTEYRPEYAEYVTYARMRVAEPNHNYTAHNFRDGMGVML